MLRLERTWDHQSNIRVPRDVKAGKDLGSSIQHESSQRCEGWKRLGIINLTEEFPEMWRLEWTWDHQSNKGVLRDVEARMGLGSPII